MYTTLAVTEVAKETTDNSTLSISGISHNTVVRIKYTVANASEGLTQAETTISPDITIDCHIQMLSSLVQQMVVQVMVLLRAEYMVLQ